MKKLQELTFYEILSYGTTRIECELKNGSRSTGTGFFMYMNDFENEEEEARPVIVTNKHVVDGAVRGNLTISTIKDELIQHTEHFNLPVSNFETFWIPHEDPDVDLCIMNMRSIEQMIMGKLGVELFYMPLSIKMIPGFNNSRKFDTLEEVIMIGYPNGIWDSHNNKPIFRKGVTATDYNLDYEGRKIFLIDMAVFGGSSGSPILSVWDGFQQHPDGSIKDFRELHIMGILYAGFQHTAEGEIQIIEIPQIQTSTVRTSIPNNLGIVIKSEKLLYFRNLFFPEKSV